MNLTISKEQIINGLQAVQGVVSTRTTLPILSDVLLRAENGRLEFTATDLDVTIASAVDASVKKPGASTVPVKRLFGIVRELNNAEIDLAVDDKNICSIQSGASFYKINGLSAEEFPPLPQFKEEKKVVLPQETLKGMMKKTSFTLKDEKGSSLLIVTKLIEGNYPNYRQVIPAETKERVALVREEFLHALRRAEIMTSEKSNSVKLNFDKNRLEITANSPEVGEAKESLAVNYKGREMAIAFNPKYMIDPLNALSNDEVFFELIDELSPGVLKINGPFLYVVMPMRLS